MTTPKKITRPELLTRFERQRVDAILADLRLQVQNLAAAQEKVTADLAARLTKAEAVLAAAKPIPR